MKNFNFQIPSKGELRRALGLAHSNPEELTDRELWILEEFGGDFSELYSSISF